MNMQLTDWYIVLGLMVFITGIAIYTRRYARSVADFLAANRCAGRYLLTIAEGEAGASAVAMVAYFELFYKAGFTGVWWQMMEYPTVIVIAVSGWIIYRFRQTRAMTVAEFLEMRYSKKFRIFMGILAFLAGIVNFGIFPAVGARFFIHFCGFPASVTFGVFSISTFVIIMLILLGISLFFTLTGGQVSVMTTDFFQGLLTSIMVPVLIFVVFMMFSWEQISEALLAAPKDASMIHPLHTTKTDGFNVWYFVMWVTLGFYKHKSWQGSQGYNCAALTPHEAKMGTILGIWRKIPWWLMLVVLTVGSYTLLHHTDFLAQAENVNEALSQIQAPTIEEQNTLRTQQTVSVALGNFLPTGIMGAMCAVVLAAFISTHNTYMHSWGCIFIQDIIMPFRKKPFSKKQHLKFLRLSIIGVVVFIFCFSLIFKQTGYILMFFQITGAIFTGGAGAVIIGGLYWKRGTTEAAWVSMIVGSGLAVTGIIIRLVNGEFFLNGMQIAFGSAIIAAIFYVLISLFGRRAIFNLDKMLHRGKYATNDTMRLHGGTANRVLTKFGITEEFTGLDRVIGIGTILWTVLWFVLFIVVTIYNIMFEVSDQSWLSFWYGYIWLMLVVSILVTCWLGIGGIRDVIRMFSQLSRHERDDADDGWVDVEESSSN
jgi:solute:Na+ symporter, SSS family